MSSNMEGSDSPPPPALPVTQPAAMKQDATGSTEPKASQEKPPGPQLQSGGSPDAGFRAKLDAQTKEVAALKKELEAANKKLSRPTVEEADQKSEAEVITDPAEIAEQKRLFEITRVIQQKMEVMSIAVKKLGLQRKNAADALKKLPVVDKATIRALGFQPGGDAQNREKLLEREAQEYITDSTLVSMCEQVADFDEEFIKNIKFRHAIMAKCLSGPSTEELIKQILAQVRTDGSMVSWSIRTELEVQNRFKPKFEKWDRRCSEFTEHIWKRSNWESIGDIGSPPVAYNAAWSRNDRLRMRNSMAIGGDKLIEVVNWADLEVTVCQDSELRKKQEKARRMYSSKASAATPDQLRVPKNLKQIAASLSFQAEVFAETHGVTTVLGAGLLGSMGPRAEGVFCLDEAERGNVLRQMEAYHKTQQRDHNANLGKKPVLPMSPFAAYGELMSFISFIQGNLMFPLRRASRLRGGVSYALQAIYVQLGTNSTTVEAKASCRFTKENRDKYMLRVLHALFKNANDVRLIKQMLDRMLYILCIQLRRLKETNPSAFKSCLEHRLESVEIWIKNGISTTVQHLSHTKRKRKPNPFFRKATDEEKKQRKIPKFSMRSGLSPPAFECHLMRGKNAELSGLLKRAMYNNQAHELIKETVGKDLSLLRAHDYGHAIATIVNELMKLCRITDNLETEIKRRARVKALVASNAPADGQAAPAQKKKKKGNRSMAPGQFEAALQKVQDESVDTLDPLWNSITVPLSDGGRCLYSPVPISLQMTEREVRDVLKQVVQDAYNASIAGPHFKKIDFTTGFPLNSPFSLPGGRVRVH